MVAATCDRRALLDHFVTHHTGVAASWARPYFRQHSDTQEAVAEAYAVAWQILDRYHDDIAFEVWMHAIVKRVSQSLQRRLSQRGRRHQSIGEIEECPEVAYDPISDKIDVDDDMDRRRANFVALHAAFAMLSPQHQTVLRRHYWQGVPQNRIANESGRSDVAVRNQVCRAKHQLQQNISRIRRMRGT